MWQLIVGRFYKTLFISINQSESGVVKPVGGRRKPWMVTLDITEIVEEMQSRVAQ